MQPDEIKNILSQLKEGKLDIDSAYGQLKDLPFKDLEFAKVDNHREIRTGYPEVIFCIGKTPMQVKKIVEHMVERNSNVLATRVNDDIFNAVREIAPGAIYHKEARAITVVTKKPIPTETYIAIVTAGTSDISVAEEAAVTAEIFGNSVERVFDVGVAGIHRLYKSLPKIRAARVVVVIAGMEGALPSIVGGLVDKPVIAVPTSIGYGASFNGLAALLGMLTSCASGIGVVNIDNGFGAGYLAGMINKL